MLKFPDLSAFAMVDSYDGGKVVTPKNFLEELSGIA